MKIRHACLDDLAELAQIEMKSYPKEEGASLESIEQRLRYFPDCFWILEEEGEIKAFVNGMRTNEPDLLDVMYEDSHIHNNEGQWQMIFSVVTAPAYRNRGYARRVLEDMIVNTKERGCQGIVLTCKEHLIQYYSSFGFINEGLSSSLHGDATWYQMRLRF